jgi:hypothetical protein
LCVLEVYPNSNEGPFPIPIEILLLVYDDPVSFLLWSKARFEFRISFKLSFPKSIGSKHSFELISLLASKTPTGSVFVNTKGWIAIGMEGTKNKPSFAKVLGFSVSFAIKLNKAWD